jgi:hypothetical protein
MNMDSALLHLSADPITCVSKDLDSATRHMGTEVHPDIPADRQITACHAPTNMSNAMQVTMNFDAIATFTLNVKEVIESSLPFSVIHNTRSNLFIRTLHQVIRRDHFGL